MSYSTISAVNNRCQIVRSVKHAKLVKWVGLVVCFFFFALVIGQEVWERWGLGPTGSYGFRDFAFCCGCGTGCCGRGRRGWARGCRGVGAYFVWRDEVHQAVDVGAFAQFADYVRQ